MFGMQEKCTKLIRMQLSIKGHKKTCKQIKKSPRKNLQPNPKSPHKNLQLNLKSHHKNLHKLTKNCII